MAILAELGLTTDDAPILLIAPSDEALGEAGAMKPRPSVVGSLMVAHPAARIVWWASREQLGPGQIERFRWMLSGVQGGEAWVVLDPDDDEPLTGADLGGLLAGSGLRESGEQALASGEVAVRVVLTEPV